MPLSGNPRNGRRHPIQNVGAYGQEISHRPSFRPRYSIARTPRSSPSPEANAASVTASSRFQGRIQRPCWRSSSSSALPEMSAPVEYAQLARALEAGGRRTGSPAGRPRNRARAEALARAWWSTRPIRIRSAPARFHQPCSIWPAWRDLTARAEELFGADDLPPGYLAPEGLAKTSAAWLIERSGFTRGFGDGPIGLSRNHPCGSSIAAGAR